MPGTRPTGNISSNKATFALAIALLITLLAGFGRAETTTQVTKDEAVPCSEFSSVFLRPQDMRYAEAAPTHFRLMGSRWASLQTTLAGYERTHMRLVGWDGQRLVPAESKDDSGFDYFIPPLASFAQLPLAQTTDLFIGGLLLSTYLLGLAGLMLVLGSWRTRAWAVLSVCTLFALCMRLGDVYVVQSSIAMVVIPWTLYACRKWSDDRRLLVFFLTVGILLGVANFVRTQAGTTLLPFCLLGIAFLKSSTARRRILLMTALLAGMATSTLYFQYAFRARDQYLRAHQADFSPAPRQHPIWHSIYIGLGFVSNPYVAGGYCDQVGISKVNALSPATSFLSPEYDRLLQKQVFDVGKHHPSVLLVNFAAKLGILQFIFVLAGNVGLFAALRHRKPRSLDLAFWTTIASGALPGLLVVPTPKYVLGAVTAVVVYGVVSLDYAMQKSAPGKLASVLAQEEKSLCAAS